MGYNNPEFPLLFFRHGFITFVQYSILAWSLYHYALSVQFHFQVTLSTVFKDVDNNFMVMYFLITTGILWYFNYKIDRPSLTPLYFIDHLPLSISAIESQWKSPETITQNYSTSIIFNTEFLSHHILLPFSLSYSCILKSLVFCFNPLWNPLSIISCITQILMIILLKYMLTSNLNFFFLLQYLLVN